MEPQPSSSVCSLAAVGLVLLPALVHISGDACWPAAARKVSCPAGLLLSAPLLLLPCASPPAPLAATDPGKPATAAGRASPMTAVLSIAWLSLPVSSRLRAWLMLL